MKLWLVCFFILFFGAEAAQWLGALPWPSGAQLSLPLTVAGGIGLAIASNYSTIFGRSSSPAGSPAAEPKTTPLPSPEAPSAAIAVAPQTPRATSKGDGISFEIKKGVRGKG